MVDVRKKESVYVEEAAKGGGRGGYLGEGKWVGNRANEDLTQFAVQV